MSTPRIRSVLSALALTLLLAAPTRSLSETISYRSDLKAADEVPPNNSPATGRLEATYDTEKKTFEYTVTFEGLAGSPTAAHFHGAAKPGTNGGPELSIPGLPVSPMHGEATLTDAQAADLAKGMWYLNIHTTAHPTGEIRGQLMRQDGPSSVGAANGAASGQRGRRSH